jgi:hypothetical protein
MNLKDKIQDRLDTLQGYMESNYHLENKDECYELSVQISKFWSILNEEDKDYIQCAQDAIREGLEWII